MKYLVLAIMLLVPSLGFAQNWSTTDLILSKAEESNTTDFSISIPNEKVELVLAALCNNAGFGEVTPEYAKMAVINYIKEQVKYYKEREAAKAVQQEELEIK